MNNLANVLRDLNRLKEAEELHRESLRIRRANLEPNHQFIRASANNLASVLQSLNQYDEAEKLYRENLNFE
jgi:hypothetical protein